MNDEIKYSKEKPKDCRYCYFWGGKKRGCELGERNCYYILPKIKHEKPKSRCETCCVGKTRLCIGWCTVYVANSIRKLRRDDDAGGY